MTRTTRPRGFAPWNPRPETLTFLNKINAVLHEYRDYLPHACRQVFYRLVGAHGFDKTKRAYSRLCEAVNRARRAQLIPFHAIRDDGGALLHIAGRLGIEADVQRKLNEGQDRVTAFRASQGLGGRA